MRISIVYIDQTSQYKCALYAGNSRRGTLYVGSPAHLTRAVDDPKSFDDTAHAAISFALDDGWISDMELQLNRDGSGWHIERTRRGASDPPDRRR